MAYFTRSTARCMGGRSAATARRSESGDTGLAIVASASASISPSAEKLDFIRTWSFSVSTMVPTFMRIARARRGSLCGPSCRF